MKFIAFLETLNWPSSIDDLGLGGATFLEMLILYETWAGEELGIELTVPQNNRNRRPNFGVVADFWVACSVP